MYIVESEARKTFRPTQFILNADTAWFRIAGKCLNESRKYKAWVFEGNRTVGLRIDYFPRKRTPHLPSQPQHWNI
jgi:hypothetical protein